MVFGLLLGLHACASTGDSLAEQGTHDVEFPPVSPPEASQDGAPPSQREQVDLDRPRPLPEPCSGIPGAPLAPLHPDLELDLEPDGDGRLEPGQSARLTARIRNRSKTQPHAAVLPGDGSDTGRREPHVWWSAFMDSGDGCWRPIELKRSPVCGIYDAEWRDEIVELAPGEGHVLRWLGVPTPDSEAERGQVRFYLHYAYGAQLPDPDLIRSTSTDLRAMEGVAPFELLSEPIEYEIRETLVLRLEAKKRRRRGRVSKIADVVTLRVENIDSEARTIVPPHAGILEFEMSGPEHRIIRAQEPADDEPPRVHPLPVGASLPLLGKSSPTPP